MTDTMTYPWHLTTEAYGGDTGRAINGTLPCVRTDSANILVCSLGAPREECDRIARLILAAPAVLAALAAEIDRWETDDRTLYPDAEVLQSFDRIRRAAGIKTEE